MRNFVYFTYSKEDYTYAGVTKSKMSGLYLG